MSQQKEERFDPPSELFVKCVFDGQGGTLVATCELCGREHFATNSNAGDYERGELERLLERQRGEPSKYVEWNDASSIGIAQIDGRQIVWGCECNKLSRYEKFILSNRELILEFLSKFSKAQKAKADRLSSLLEDASK